MRTAIIGLQWGDEGKGKVVAYFSQFYDCVVRYSGGSNAGHTIEYKDGAKIVNHLLPSFYKGKDMELIISSGVVVDLEVLAKEIEEVKRICSKFPKLMISNLAHVVFPYHKLLDEKIDRETGIGTTRRGIGPAYVDKINRIGVRLADFENLDIFYNKIEVLKTFYQKIYGIEVEIGNIHDYYNKIAPYVVSQLEIIDNLKNKKVLFEGTQGVLLDLDMGTYPYVTGSNCSVTGIQNGLGFPVQIDKSIGVFKAYQTRVGNGPFPTELFGSEADFLRKKGKEYGATTGRPRRVGWLDLVLLKYAVTISGVDELVITKGDILNNIEKIPVCVAYEISGRKKDCINNIDEIVDAKPIYKYLNGWNSINDKTFLEFLKFIEDYLGVKIKYISYGPKIEEIKQI
ncbi:MAG: adenylosuccinate synthase [Thermosipho sp. (in: Bacteria)]|nr:adenylosuccinate synthase [Thermosipho sp. (in: thermotogales)]